MEIVRLKYFSAVAETGSVRKVDVENTTMKQLAKAVRILCKPS
jgi:hypothetical protein